MIMVAIISIIAALAAFFGVLSHIVRHSNDDGWEYLMWPQMEGKYKIRLEDGTETKAEFRGDSWYDLEGYRIDQYYVDCWKEI